MEAFNFTFNGSEVPSATGISGRPAISHYPFAKNNSSDHEHVPNYEISQDNGSD